MARDFCDLKMFSMRKKAEEKRNNNHFTEVKNQLK